MLHGWAVRDLRHTQIESQSDVSQGQGVRGRPVTGPGPCPGRPGCASSRMACAILSIDCTSRHRSLNFLVAAQKRSRYVDLPAQ
eukprot:4192954-Prymnesium_polylepis.1